MRAESTISHVNRNIRDGRGDSHTCRGDFKSAIHVAVRGHSFLIRKIGNKVVRTLPGTMTQSRLQPVQPGQPATSLQSC